MIVTDATFKEVVMNTTKPVIIDFWAEWCGPCKMVAPILEELELEYEGSLVIAKVNVDENQRCPAKFGVRSIPTLIFMKDGQQLDTIIGVQGKSYLKEKIKKHFNL